MIAILTGKNEKGRRWMILLLALVCAYTAGYVSGDWRRTVLDRPYIWDGCK